MIRWWIYDFIMYAYALSLLFHVADVAGHRRGAKNVGAGLLVLVWLLQTLFFVHRIWEVGFSPILNWFETLFVFSWLLVSLSLTMRWQKQQAALLLGVNMISFALMAVGRFTSVSGERTPVPEGLDAYGNFLIIHIGVALASYAAFTMAAISSVLYLYLFRRLKDKRWSPSLKRLPGLEQVERLSGRATLAGIVLLAGALCVGGIGLWLESGGMSGWDWKTAFSLLLLAGYAWLAYRRWRRNWPAMRLAKWNICMYLLLGMNFFVSNRLSDFHRWL